MKEKSKVLAKKLINSTPALKELAVGVYGWMNRRRYQNIKKHTPTEEKTVVFESFLGRQYGCSPKALFLEMSVIRPMQSIPSFGCLPDGKI